MASRLETLGIESGDDLTLLSEEDLVAPELPQSLQHRIDRTFPPRIDLPEAAYEVDYDLDRREVLLTQVEGKKTRVPPLSLLPAFTGFRIRFRHRDLVQTLKG